MVKESKFSNRKQIFLILKLKNDAIRFATAASNDCIAFTPGISVCPIKLCCVPV